MTWWRRKKAEEIERRTPKQQELPDLDLHQRVGQLEHQVEVLDGQFRTLRGYVYVKKGFVGPDDQPPPGPANIPQQQRNAPQSKEELRRTLISSGRFIPGQPPKHE